MLPKVDELKLIAKIRTPHIVCVTETWLNASVDSSLISISDYHVCRSDRSYRRGGGIAVYIRRDIAYFDITETFDSLTNFEVKALDIFQLKIILICVYIPPSETADTLRNIHASLVSTVDAFLLAKPRYNVIISGDMNHFKVSHLCSDLDMTDMVTKPTRQGNILDHILMSKELTSNYDRDDVIYDAPISSSDHKTIFCKPKGIRTTSPILRWHKIFDYRQSNIDYLFHEASSINWNATLSQDESVDVSWKKFHTVILSLLKQCIPSRLVPISNNDKEWITPITKMLIIDRWNAFRSGQWSLYNHLKAKVKSEIQKAKKLWAERLMSTTNGLWTLVNKHRKKQNGDVSPLIASFGKEEALLKFLTEHLTAHFSANNAPSSAIEDSVDCVNSDDWNFQVTEYQVYQILKRYPVKKAHGLDEIPTRIYVELAILIAKPLSIIYNQSLKQRKFPDDWKVGRLVAIPKTNPPAPDKLRFLALLPLPSKILEKLVAVQLRHEFIHASGKEQHGFRPRASTTTALLKICDVAAHLYDDRLNFGLAILSYDLSSAFDTVDHSRALQKMRELAFPNGFLNWLRSYFCNRSSILKIDTISSTPIAVERGVPQGSVLGPLIFCTYVRDFTAASDKATVVKYADDITIILPLETGSHDSIRTSINRETSNISIWCEENRLTLNSTKSKCLLVTRHNSCNIEGLTVQSVPSLKLLGLNFNSKLNWDTHVDKLRLTCCRRLHILRKLRGLISRRNLLLVYTAIIRSLLEYACPVFVGLNKKNSIILQKIEKRAYRIIFHDSTNADDTDNTADAHLKSRRLDLSTRLWNTIEKDTEHVLHQTIPKRHRNTNKLRIEYHRTDKLGNSFFQLMARTLNNCK